jgi:hypothetical protein
MKHILLLSISLLVFSCNSGKSIESGNSSSFTDGYIWTWEDSDWLDDTSSSVLKKYILEFIDSTKHLEHEENIVTLTVRLVNDSTIRYYISRSFSAHSLVGWWTPLLFLYVKEHLIAVYSVGMFDFSLRNAPVIVDIVKAKFPKEYEYYLKHGHYRPPDGGRDLVWALTFQDDGQLIEKEILWQ